MKILVAEELNYCVVVNLVLLRSKSIVKIINVAISVLVEMSSSN